MSRRDSSERMAFLRREIARIEARGPGSLPARPIRRDSCGETAYPAFLRASRLSGGLHEIAPAAAPDGFAALGLALRLAALCARARPARGLVLAVEDFVVLETGAPYGPGLVEAGVDPDRLVILRTQGPRETLGAMEEALRSRAVAAVLAESAVTARAYTLDVSRRLALAAQTGGGAGLLVPLALAGAGARLSSAAATRLEVLRGAAERKPHAGREARAPPGPAPLPGPPVVGLRLLKARGLFGIDSDKVHEVAFHAFSFDSPALSGDRPDPAQPAALSA